MIAHAALNPAIFGVPFKWHSKNSLTVGGVKLDDPGADRAQEGCSLSRDDMWIFSHTQIIYIYMYIYTFLTVISSACHDMTSQHLLASESTLKWKKGEALASEP